MPVPAPQRPYALFLGIDVAAAVATAVWQRTHQAPTRPLTMEQTPAGMTLGAGMSCYAAATSGSVAASRR